MVAFAFSFSFSFFLFGGDEIDGCEEGSWSLKALRL